MRAKKASSRKDKLLALAEERLKKKRIRSSPPSSKTEMLKVVHELQVHQVELEIQNEELRQARDRTEEVLQQYAMHYDFAPSGSFTVDERGVISELNLNGAAMLGKERSYLVGRDFRKYILYDMRPLFEEFLKGVFDRRVKGSCEVMIETRSLPPKFVHIEGKLVEDRGHCLMIAADITEFKNLHNELVRSRDRLERLIKDLTLAHNQLLEAQKLAHIGTWELNVGTGELNWSEELYSIFGLDHSQTAPRYADLLRMMTPESVGLLEKEVPLSLETGEPHELELELVRPGGEHRNLFVRASALRSAGKVTDFRGIAQDITERKRAEATILQSFGDLQRSNKELEQFADVASHDLREPLRMVVSFAQLLAKKYKGRLDAEAQELITSVVDGALVMQSLLSGLFTYSRAGRSTVPFEPVDCNGVVRQALLNLQPSIDECAAVVKYDPLPTVDGDRTQLIELFQNLIGNAIKFRGEAKPLVVISCSRSNAEWVFRVTDNGIGIDPRYHERIFMIFQRADRAEDYEGTGIGLAVCRKIVDRHRGKIWVDSQPGEGSAFYFSIPKQKD